MYLGLWERETDSAFTHHHSHSSLAWGYQGPFWLVVFIKAFISKKRCFGFDWGVHPSHSHKVICNRHTKDWFGDTVTHNTTAPTTDGHIPGPLTKAQTPADPAQLASSQEPVNKSIMVWHLYGTESGCDREYKLQQSCAQLTHVNGKNSHWGERSWIGVVMILPQVHLRKPCYDFTFL